MKRVVVRRCCSRRFSCFEFLLALLPLDAAVLNAFDPWSPQRFHRPVSNSRFVSFRFVFFVCVFFRRCVQATADVQADAGGARVANARQAHQVHRGSDAKTVGAGVHLRIQVR